LTQLCDSAETIAIFTIGHSTHPLAEFIRLLQDNGVTLVADVRLMFLLMILTSRS
jgi:uncharacterized protein (DUF488 family)